MSESTAVAEPDVVIAPAEPQVRRKSKANATSRTKKQPPYAVIVENDDLHTWPYVVEVLQKVFGYNRPKAYLLTAQVHFSGQSVVWSGSLEVAELKRDQIRGCGPDHYGSKPVTFPLGVRIEKMPG
jgi:ATP-dependent Clp protease adaptor protein ClpS